jgi:DNA-binding LytR/AlgR family response regulator
MKELNKRYSVIGLILAAYSAIVLAIFNPFELITSQSFLLPLLISVGFIFVIFIGLILLVKLVSSSILKKTLFCASFAIAPFASAIITFLLFSEERSHFAIYISSFIVSALLPLSLAILYTIFQDIQSKITISSETAEQESDDSVLKLTNDNGKVLLNVKLSRIICFEANDNYVVTYFNNSKGELEKSMERVSMKKIEEILTPLSRNFQRVHKSYIVNQLYVIQVQGKAQSYRLKLDGLSIDVPVSRNFDIEVFQKN